MQKIIICLFIVSCLHAATAETSLLVSLLAGLLGIVTDLIFPSVHTDMSKMKQPLDTPICCNIPALQAPLSQIQIFLNMCEASRGGVPKTLSDTTTNPDAQTDACDYLCVGQNLQLLDYYGNLNTVAINNYITSIFANDATSYTFYSAISTQCFAIVNANKSYQFKCNDSYYLYTQCVNALQVVNCPASYFNNIAVCTQYQQQLLASFSTTGSG